MTEQEFQTALTTRTKETERVIESFLPAEEGGARTVIEAMNYSVRAGGKRLRPLFMLETAGMYGGREELFHPFMAALEMIHTYSLVHDDLPAMDNDEYRRGRKTTWAVYGEGMAVIAGDGLLNYAFETARGLRCGSKRRGDPPRYKSLEAPSPECRRLWHGGRTVRGHHDGYRFRESYAGAAALHS